MKIHVETDRLILRDIEARDEAGIFELDSDPDVHEFLGKNPITTREEARKVIELIRSQYASNGIGRWAIIDKETEEFIGWTGLKLEKNLRSEFSYYDLGYRLRKKYWGKGIATETAMESMKYGFKKLGLKEIGAAADINHSASNKVLQKVGLNLIETFEFEGVPHNWYNVEKAAWLRKS